MSDSNDPWSKIYSKDPVAQSLNDYWTAKNTGVNWAQNADGISGLIARDSQKSGDKSGSKVICTELARQGLITKDDYSLCIAYSSDYLNEKHFRGYHFWAVNVVRRMRKSKKWTALFRSLAQARVEHIAWRYGDSSRGSRLGWVLCAVGEPICFGIGALVGQQDWRKLYNGTNIHGKGTVRS